MHEVNVQNVDMAIIIHNNYQIMFSKKKKKQLSNYVIRLGTKKGGIRVVMEVTIYAWRHDVWHQSSIRESHVGKVIINNLFLKKTTLHWQTTYAKNYSVVIAFTCHFLLALI